MDCLYVYREISCKSEPFATIFTTLSSFSLGCMDIVMVFPCMGILAQNIALFRTASYQTHELVFFDFFPLWPYHFDPSTFA